MKVKGPQIVYAVALSSKVYLLANLRCTPSEEMFIGT